jgi:hypothetical protein
MAANRERAPSAGGGVVTIPWYATVFRGDKLQAALEEIAPLASRYNATHYEVLRSREDRYRFQQSATFDDKLDFERYWYGPEFMRFRVVCSGLFQVPVVPEWHDRVALGVLEASGGHWAETEAEATAD